jgi:hypothetical protein
MTKDDYDPDCHGCQISQGKGKDVSNVLLPGSWSLNHYGGPEGYLGWLALQPVYHRMAFSELTDEELGHLGPNIRDMNASSRNIGRRSLMIQLSDAMLSTFSRVVGAFMSTCI